MLNEVTVFESPPQSPTQASGMVQEALSPRSLARATMSIDTDGSAYLKRLIQSHLGQQYRLVATVRRMMMRLRIYAHEKIDVNDVQASAQNTGVAGLANKGGLVASLKIKGTSLCFISAHLAAHEGAEFLKKRHQGCSMILHRAKTNKVDLDAQYSHTFFFGDLNYRLDSSSSTLKDLTWEQQREAVVEMIEKEDWKTLNELDELQRELTHGCCLGGFQTPLCHFAPTFKTLRYSTQYSTQRIPSYCDRITYKSLPGLEKRLTLCSYESCPDFMTSDHKPIRGSFEIKLLPKLTPVIDGYPRLIFTQLSAVDLPIMDYEVNGALSDPYLRLQVSPAELLLNKHPVKTSVIKRELNPIWKDEGLVLLPAVAKGDPLDGIFVLITCIDWDMASSDDVIGFANLNLAQVVEESGSKGASSHHHQHPFEVQLLKGGLKRGMVRGQIKVEWPKIGEFFKEHRKTLPCCHAS